MRYGNLLLPLLAIGALAMGVAAQRPQKKEPPLAQTLFAKATADDFLGDETCAGCHGQVVEDFKRSGHAAYMHNPKDPIQKQGCEGCHGPGKFHLDEENPEIIAFTQIEPEEINAACLRCHGDVMTASDWRHTDHAKANVSCISCHQIHPAASDKNTEQKTTAAKGVIKKGMFAAVKPPKALLRDNEATLCGSCHPNVTNQFRQNSHHPLPEGRVVCSDCHETHKTRGSKEKEPLGLKDDGLFMKEKCAKCHAETAGPFVFEHEPVTGFIGEGCAECHKPHGSQNPRLLKGFSNGICAQCHTDMTKDHYTGRSCWAAGCHVAIHGSNSDPNLLAP